MHKKKANKASESQAKLTTFSKSKLKSKKTDHNLDDDDEDSLLFTYKPNQKVFCQHKGVFYPATILATKFDDKQNGLPVYQVHYSGWNKKWDEWVLEDYLQPITSTNSDLAQKSQNLAKASKEKVSKKVEKEKKLQKLPDYIIQDLEEISRLTEVPYEFSHYITPKDEGDNNEDIVMESPAIIKKPVSEAQPKNKQCKSQISKQAEKEVSTPTSSRSSTRIIALKLQKEDEEETKKSTKKTPANQKAPKSSLISKPDQTPDQKDAENDEEFSPLNEEQESLFNNIQQKLMNLREENPTEYHEQLEKAHIYDLPEGLEKVLWMDEQRVSKLKFLLELPAKLTVDNLLDEWIDCRARELVFPIESDLTESNFQSPKKKKVLEKDEVGNDTEKKTSTLEKSPVFAGVFSAKAKRKQQQEKLKLGSKKPETSPSPSQPSPSQQDYSKRKQTIEAKIETYRKHATGLRYLFNQTLGTSLLFKFERIQLDEFLEERGVYEDLEKTGSTEEDPEIDFPYSSVYPPHHLLRLLAILPELMIVFSEEKRKEMMAPGSGDVHYWRDMLRFMEERRERFFEGEDYYVTAMPWYIRKVTCADFKFGDD